MILEQGNKIQTKARAGDDPAHDKTDKIKTDL